MHVLQVGDSLAVRSGGTAAACAQLANHLVRLGVNVSVLTLGERHDDGPIWALDPAVARQVCDASAARRLGYCPRLPALVSSLARPDLVHVHGLWRLHYAQAARYAHRLGVPVIVSAHGMLHDLALAQKAGLKRIARWLYQDKLLRSVRCLHATAADEAVQLRRLGFDRPIAVVAWGVDAPPDDHKPLPDTTSAPVRRNLVYFGRLHPQKGLDTLLRAWSDVRGRCPGWRLVIAGSDADHYRTTLVTLASELAVADSVAWIGAAEGVARERLFADADLMVLPSPRENFGLVVAEALVRGVPVIATHGAPWASLIEERCGWWIPADQQSLTATLADALVRSPQDLKAMGERGRRFARTRFAWADAARAMVDLYTWAIGRGPQPNFVRS